MLVGPDRPAHAVRLADDWSMLRSFRVWAGMTQQELADAVGASRATISSLERGRSTPSVALVLALARRLHASVEELFAADPLR
jgi:putative transcriptional regulator